MKEEIKINDWMSKYKKYRIVKKKKNSMIYL